MAQDEAAKHIFQEQQQAQRQARLSAASSAAAAAATELAPMAVAPKAAAPAAAAAVAAAVAEDWDDEALAVCRPFDFFSSCSFLVILYNMYCNIFYLFVVCVLFYKGRTIQYHSFDYFVDSFSFFCFCLFHFLIRCPRLFPWAAVAAAAATVAVTAAATAWPPPPLPARQPSKEPPKRPPLPQTQHQRRT